jgi:hypothetical protein
MAKSLRCRGRSALLTNSPNSRRMRRWAMASSGIGFNPKAAWNCSSPNTSVCAIFPASGSRADGDRHHCLPDRMGQSRFVGFGKSTLDIADTGQHAMGIWQRLQFAAALLNPFSELRFPIPPLDQQLREGREVVVGRQRKWRRNQGLATPRPLTSSDVGTRNQTAESWW